MSAAKEVKPEEKPKSLATKLAEVMGEVERIAKNGRNDAHGYDYATEADITAAVRKHLSDRRVMMMPDVVGEPKWEVLGKTKSGVDRKLCTLTVKFTFIDGETGEERSFTVLGQGEDTGDKATYKAMTGATKYALMKTFLIPTGDDPENDTEHRYTPAKESAPAPQAQAPKRAAAPAPVDSPVVPFGKTKGKRLSEIDGADLEYHLKAAAKSVALKDPKWHAKNEAWLKACQAETARRVFPAPQAELDVGGLPSNTDDEALELLAQEFGLNKARITLRARGILNGKTSNFTQEDIATLRSALQAVPA